MASECEEVVVAADLRHVEQLAPQRGEQGFQFAFGRGVDIRDQCVGVRCGQRGTIQLAVGRERQRVHVDEGRGDHVLGQARGELGAQGGWICSRTVADEIGDQPFVIGTIDDDHRLAHAAATQGGFDLAQFDAHAAQLDLIVVAAEIVQRAVGTPARHIARAVHALAGLLGERIGDEAFGGQIGTAQIAACQLHTGDLQFAGHADGRALPLCIEHVQLRIGDRPADRHAVGIGLGALPDADVHRRFGRAVEVVQARLRQTCADCAGQIRWQGFAAADDALQAGACALR